jgi:hypothetical protein
MVECSAFRRRSASNDRNDLMRRTSNPKKKSTMATIANTNKAELSLPSEFSQDTQENFLVRAYPEAHVWHSLDSFKNPNRVVQEPLLTVLLPPKHASGYRHRANMASVLEVLSSTGILHQPSNPLMVVVSALSLQDAPTGQLTQAQSFLFGEVLLRYLSSSQNKQVDLDM